MGGSAIETALDEEQAAMSEGRTNGGEPIQLSCIPQSQQGSEGLHALASTMPLALSLAGRIYHLLK